LFQIAAISEQASKSTRELPNSEENSSSPLGWKSFDMRAVVSATEDFLQFILSEKGLRVRIFLLRDIIGAADVLLEDEVIGRTPSEKLEAIETSKSEVCLN
jgi:aarF domain-containing kinase